MLSEVKQADVRRVFQACCLATSPAEMENVLQRECRGDAELRRAVQELLQAEHRHAALLEASPSSLLGDVGGDDFKLPRAMLPEGTAPGTAEKIGSSINGYKLLQQIGEGGFGSVYMAQQSQPVRRKVALKIIKPGMDSKEVIARFEAERQALAMMDHPNVAKVLDAGTTETGLPYFVMELVHGTPITKFCDENRLSNRERLEIFADVCRAVQHAHLKGIIHRDLKPSNVLVTMNDDKPMPKVIDFGVSKALSQPLTDKTMFTALGQMVGTPLYMSPEQAQFSAHDVDVRSDVYSLGVLLYELLTGSTPFDKETLRKSGLDEMRRLIREVDPPRPSIRVSTLRAQALSTVAERRQVDNRNLSQSLRNELDWIVMKALEKDRTRRYESARDLSDDIQNYLKDEPVKACPPTVAYRLKKYAWKHKGLLTTAAILAAMLVTSTIVSTTFAMQSRAAQQAAEKSADDADRQRKSAVDAENLADERLAAEEKARQLAEQERERADESFTAALDAIEQLLAHVGNPELAGIPKIQEIRASILEDSLDFYQRFKVDSGTSSKVDYRAAKVYLQLGQLAQATHPDSRKVVEAYEVGLKLTDALVLKHPKQNDFRELKAEMHMACADYWWLPAHIAKKEDYAKAMKHYEQAEQQYARLSQEDPDPDHYERMRGHVFAKMSNLCSSQSKKDPGIVEFARLAFESGFISHPLMAKAMGSSDPDLAEQHWRKFVAGEGELGELSGWNGNPSAVTYNKKLAARFFSNRDTELADRLWREAFLEEHALEKDFPSDSENWQRLDDTKKSYAKFLLRTEDLPDALSKVEGLIQSDSAFHLVRAQVLNLWDEPDAQLRMLNESIRRFPTQSEYYRSRAGVFEQQGELDAALADLNRVLAIDGNHQYALSRRGKLHSKLQNFRQAIDDFTTLFPMRSGDPWGSRRYRADAYFQIGDYDASLADLKQAMDQKPNDLSPLTWISESEITACENDDFKKGLLELADRAVELNEGSAQSRTARAYLLLRLGQFERARDDLSQIIQRQDGFYYDTYQAALMALELGDRAAFRKLSQKLVSITDDDSEPIAKHFAAWTASLSPDALDNYVRAIELASAIVQQDSVDSQYITGMGAILMRAGKYDEAKTQLDRAIEAGKNEKTSPSYTRYFLAMTEHHLGNPEASQEHLRKANEIAESELLDTPAWNRNLTLELLRAEAEALISPAGDEHEQQAASPATTQHEQLEPS